MLDVRYLLNSQQAARFQVTGHSGFDEEWSAEVAKLPVTDGVCLREECPLSVWSSS
jgi:hypothetical protein